MNIIDIRSILAEVYTGASWKTKVRNMTDEQAFATYKRMERTGQLYKHNRRTEHVEKINTGPASYVTTDAEGRVVWITRAP